LDAVKKFGGKVRDFETQLPIDLLKSVQRGTMNYSYKGIPMLKDPFDLALYQLVLWEQKPCTIIEIGSYKGGSAVWFADQTRSMQLDTKIFSLDIHAVDGIDDERVSFKTSPDISLAMPLDWLAALPRPLLVIEDSAHTYEHTLLVLRHFAGIMRSGEYLIVEDGIASNMGLDVEHGLNGGPSRALEAFLNERSDFRVDEKMCDFFGHNVTYNVNGYLVKT
jgi:cephalosporin hydroxylase